MTRPSPLCRPFPYSDTRYRPWQRGWTYPRSSSNAHFVYNGLQVDSQRLQDEHATVRQMLDRSLYELPRNHARERQWRERLAQILPAPIANREVWLEFMLDAVPALQTDGWEVAIADAFPYRIATADDWYGDLESDRRQGWFDLRLGVVVDGQHVNLLPALARYLQTSAGRWRPDVLGDGRHRDPRASGGLTPVAA